MTSRERVQAAFDRRTPDRVPCHCVLTGKDLLWVQETFERVDPESALRFMLTDFRYVFPPYIGPELTISPRTGARMTVWGITEKDGDYSVDGFPMEGASRQQIEDYRYPLPEWFDFAAMRQPDPLARDQMIVCGEPFSLMHKAADLMSLPAFMMNLYDAPDLVHQLMGKIADARYAFIDQLLKATPWIDMVFFADDLGTQTSLLVSPPSWCQFVQPHLKRLADLVHSHGKIVYYHSCGSIMKMIPDLIDAGIDMLDNIQPTAGMDPYAVKKEFGGRIVVQAQVDQQVVMRQWKPVDIYRKYRKVIEDLAPGGGFVLSPVFRSQNTPPENLLALLKAIAEPL